MAASGSKQRIVVGVGVALVALAVLAVIGPTAYRALRALRHHGIDRARQEVLRFEPPWRGPWVAYERATPGQAGVDAKALAAWSQALASRGTRHLLLIRDGKLVHEWIAPGARANDLVHVSAVAKGSAAAPALGVLVDEGRVGFDDPVWRYVAAWKDDPVRSQITLRMLLNHTSGIQNIVYGGDGAGLSGWEKVFSDDHAQRFPLTLSRAEVRFAPGSRVEYTSLAYYALSYALTQALRGPPAAGARPVPSDLYDLLAQRIHEPLEIPPEAWQISYGRHEEMDGLRLFTLASGAAYTPRALARLGELFLGDGRFRGRLILSADTVAALLSDQGVPPTRAPDLPAPALGWWLNRDGFFPSLPEDAVLSAGSNHRILLVVPSRRLVMVRLGSWIHESGVGAGYWDGVDDVVFAPLMDALRP